MTIQNIFSKSIVIRFEQHIPNFVFISAVSFYQQTTLTLLIRSFPYLVIICVVSIFWEAVSVRYLYIEM